MNTYGVIIANNHIGDYGEGAIMDTLDLMGANNIFCAGAGENIEKAYKAFYVEKTEFVLLLYQFVKMPV